MASQKFGKGTEQFQMFTDYWKFVQEFYIVEDNDDWWTEVARSADALCKKYGNGQYIRDLAMAHIKELERKRENS